MKKIKTKSAFEIAVNMLAEAENGNYVYAVLFYDAAVAVIRNLMCIDDVNVFGLHIGAPEYDDYNKEYYVSLDPELVLSVEPAWTKKNEYHDAGYLGFDADVVLIDGDAKSKIIGACETKATMVELDMSECDLDIDYGDDEDNCDEDCDCCCYDDCNESDDESDNLNDGEKLQYILDFLEFVKEALEE